MSEAQPPSQTAPAPPPIQSGPPAPAIPPKHNGNGRRLWIFTFILIICGLLWLAYYLLYLQYHQYTDDAYANGNMININSAVQGSVIAFYADDTDLVTEGQVLVKLDDTDYRIAYDRELASLAEVALQVKQIYDTVRVNEAAVVSKTVAVGKARYDYDNRTQLIDVKAVSNEDFVHSKDDLATAEAQLQEALEQLNVSRDAAGTTEPDKHPLLEKQRAAVRSAYYNLQHCTIYAPSTGYVAQRSVNVGQWARPSDNLMAVIPIDYVWVDANYKETQLAYMRIGQPADVWFDLYGSDVKFEGKVLGIASGTGSVFSIIPPQNATGNWIKIVQRLPVRIGLDPNMLKKYPIRIGLSAEVNVDITEYEDLPMLAPTSHIKCIATTDVFRLDFGPIDTLIEEVVRKALGTKGGN